MRIETEHLLLRPFEAGDVDDSLEYRNDPEFARFLPHIPQPFTRTDAEQFVHVNMTEPFDVSPTLAVVLDGKVIGTVNLEIDLVSRTAMIGYGIGRRYWERGLAVEAARAVIGWAFADLKLEGIWASTSLENLRSQRVLEKLGMSPSRGTKEPRFEISGEEWRQQVKEKLDSSP